MNKSTGVIHISRGQTTVPILVVIGAICTWCGALSIGVLNNYTGVSSLKASVADIKENTANVPTLKAEVDWLVSQKGYTIAKLSTTTPL